MSAKNWILSLLITFSISLSAPSFAEETGAMTTDTPAAATEGTGTPATPAEMELAAPAAETPAAPAVPAAPPEPTPVTPPALKPITITFSGELGSVNSTETPAVIVVQDRYGVKKEIAVPTEAKISLSGTAKSVTDLKAGDKLTVEYTYDVATGKRTAQSISLGEAAPAGR